MKLSSLTPVAAVLAVSLTAVAHAETSNPFAAKPLSTIVVADNHEGKCGGMKKEEGAKEGSCGGMKKGDSAKEGSCGGKMVKEGKCGEGKCGGRMMEADTNKDGQISKTEFMAKHEAVFTEVDTNKDGMLDEKERQAMHGKMMKEGKCGEGKCGGKMKSHK
jgi:uncharacterized low-complexity protein